MARKASLIAVALIALWAVAAPAAAQVTGIVTGTIKDAQGGVIPGATVVLIDEARGTQSAPAVTNATGDYVFPNVSPGTYTVEVTMSGFKTLKRAGVAVSGGDRVSVGVLSIEVGGMSEVVDVKAEVPLVQAQSGERSFTVTTAAVENLPIQSRSYIDLADQAVGVAPGVRDPNAAAGTGSFFPPMRLGGGTGVNDQIMLDGAGIIDTGGANIRLAPNVDVIAEVKVETSGYQAEFGRGSGIQIAGVTKSGTNQFRGSVYDIERNSKWNTNDWVNQQRGLPKQTLKQKDWGYTFGGPVGKPGGASNKLFFFFSQEWRPRTAGGEQFMFRLPTALERQGDFSQTRDQNGNLYPYIRDYTTGLACTAANTSGCFQSGGVIGRIPQNRLNALGLSILNQWPQPNSMAGFNAGTQSYNHVDTMADRSGYLVQHSLRMDYQVSPKLRVSGKAVYETKNKVLNSPNIAFGQGASHLTGYNDALETQPQQLQYTATGNWNVNQSTFVEGTWGMFQNQTGAPTQSPLPTIGAIPLIFPTANIVDPRFYLFDRLSADNPPWVSKDASGKLLAILPPTFAFGNLVSPAPPPYAGFNCCININTVNDVSLSVTKLFGRHTIKAGFWYQHSFKEQTTGNFRGSVSFAEATSNPLDSTFGYANAALGIFNSLSQSSRFLASGFLGVSDDFYVQDNWKVSNKLTLDYGMRFVHQVPGYDKYGLASNFVPLEWDRSKAPVLYKPVCAAGVASCSGNAVLAFNPLTGQTLGAGSSTIVGSIVPGSGVLANGIFLEGTGPVPDTTYNNPFLAYGPRFGIAYDPKDDHKMVLRGGMGVYYDRPFGTAGPVNQPPTSITATLTNATLTDVTPGVGLSSPSAITMNDLDSKLATSVQYNAGIQMVIPWSLVLDVAYVGSHNFNEAATVDVNGLPFGAAYLAQNQDPTKTASTIPGNNAYAVNFLRPLQGFGAINRTLRVNWNRFNSLQTSLNRRFRNGVQFTVNYTLSRNHGTDGQGVRVDVDGKGGVTVRADQAQLDYPISAGATGTGSSDQTHVAKVVFVWLLPSLRGDTPARRGLGYVVNDWQLSGVWNGASGIPYSVGYTYSNGVGAMQLTGTPSYNARIVINGDPGSGCSTDLTRQFVTSVFSGPQPNSLGLESGANYLRGCASYRTDLAIARNIKLGRNRTVQFRLEAYNVLNSIIINNRNTTATFASYTSANAITSLPYAADGTTPRTATSAIPGGASAGFGVATSALPMRTMQAQIRFAF